MTRSELISTVTAFAGALAEGPAVVSVLQNASPCKVLVQVSASARLRVLNQQLFTEHWRRHFPHGQHVLFDPSKISVTGEALSFILHLPMVRLED